MSTAAIANSPATGTGVVNAIERTLRAARRRLLAQRFIDWLCACFLGTGGLLLAAGAFNLFRERPPFDPGRLELALGTAFLVALVGTTAGWISLAFTAKLIDARARTHDRFHTALIFSARAPRSAFEELTLAECTRFGEAFPLRRWTPLRLPQAARYLPVPAIALGLLCWHASLHIGEPPADPVLAAAIAQRAAALEALAARLRQPDAAGKSPDLERLAAEMKRSAEHLKDSTHLDATDKLKGALGELSSLEAMLAAMKQAAAGQKASPAELAALSAALAANAQTQDAAKSMQEGKMEQAAAQLEQLLQKLQQQGNTAQALQQLTQSMQEQTAKLTAAEKNEVARQMEQAAQAAQAGQAEVSAAAMQRLADLLRQLGQNVGAGRAAGGSGSGRSMTQQELQNLLNALENMKAGLSDPSQGGAPQPGQSGQLSLAQVESFAHKSGDSDKGSTPSGQPGSDHDQGTTDKIFADHPLAASTPAKAASRIEGVLGDGQSLQELVGAGSDHAKASRPYRELYNAMAPAARDAVEQEDIPLGSRFFIGRYFENIRPAD